MDDFDVVENDYDNQDELEVVVSEKKVVNPEERMLSALEYIKDNAKVYAQAKAELEYLEAYKHSLRSNLMKGAETQGITANNAQESDALAHPSYKAHLEAIREAVANESMLKWKMEAARIQCDVYRSIMASQRIQDKNV